MSKIVVAVVENSLQVYSCYSWVFIVPAAE